MQRLFLPALTVVVLGLILADHIGPRQRGSVAQSPEILAIDLPESSLGATVRPPTTTRLPGETGIPTVERLARLATRRTLSSEGRTTYLDSLLLSTDSVLRRWPVPLGRPLRVALVEGGPSAYTSRMSGYVRDAFRFWENLGIDLRFTIGTDTAGADITVKWISRFGIDRTGQTDLTWDQFGRVQRAIITLAISDGQGRVLPSTALLSVAIHEAGHALGLPHSASPTDVMFPEPRIIEISPRDQQTATLLYQLPAGSVKDSVYP